MKKVVLSLCLMLLVANTFAQKSFYLKAGLGGTTIQDFTDLPDGMKNRDIGWRLSYQAGAGIKVPVTEKFGLRAEFLYLNKGFGSDSTKLSVHFHNIGIGTLATYQITNKIEIEAGLLPNFSFAIHNNEGQDITIFNIYRRFDLATQLGFNIGITEKLSLNPGLVYGLLTAIPGKIYFTDDNNNILGPFKTNWHHLQTSLSLRYSL